MAHAPTPVAGAATVFIPNATSMRAVRITGRLKVEDYNNNFYESFDGLIWTKVGSCKFDELLIKHDSSNGTFSYFKPPATI